jgi:hypothetical protein
MRGRARGNQERIVLLAHQVEVMARQKVLKRADAYLPKANVPKPSGAMAVLEMLRRMKARQDLGQHD